MEIYEYNETQQKINLELERCEGVLDEELIAKLALLDISRQQIIETAHRKIKNDMLLSASIKAESDRLALNNKQLKIKISQDCVKLENFMQNELSEGKTIKNAIGEIKFGLKGGSCLLNDGVTAKDLPVEFQDVKTTAKLGDLKKQLATRPELEKYVHLTEKYRELSVK